MSWNTSWDELWVFAQPTGEEFFKQLDQIVRSSSPEFQKIILKCAPQEVKDRYNNSQHKSQKYEHIPTEQELYKSLGITEKQVQQNLKMIRANRNGQGSQWIERHFTYRIIQSFFGGLRMRTGRR